MGFLLNVEDSAGLGGFLRAHGWISPERRVRRLERAGEGNMNLVLRAHLDDGATLIVKQSRGWVEKYPQIAAPEERILSEVAFYQAVAPFPAVAARLPALRHFAEVDRLACFADLGSAADLTDAYGAAGLPGATLTDLLGWLSALHALDLDPDDWGAPLANRAMRALNHAHMFVLPLDADAAPDADGFTPGLGAVAAELRADRGFTDAVQRLGELYLSDGRTLLHGDFYPGSWLRHPSGVKVIDPEFAFFGAPEFDVGVSWAHLHFAGWRDATAEAALRAGYAAPAHFRWEVARGFAGVELMRRLLGVAQLPLSADLAQKRAWLEMSRAYLSLPPFSVTARGIETAPYGREG